MENEQGDLSEEIKTEDISQQQSDAENTEKSEKIEEKSEESSKLVENEEIAPSSEEKTGDETKVEGKEIIEDENKIKGDEGEIKGEEKIGEEKATEEKIGDEEIIKDKTKIGDETKEDEMKVGEEIKGDETKIGDEEGIKEGERTIEVDAEKIEDGTKIGDEEKIKEDETRIEGEGTKIVEEEDFLEEKEKEEKIVEEEILDDEDEDEEYEEEKRKPEKVEYSPLGPVVSSLFGDSVEDEEEVESEEEKYVDKFEPINRDAYIEEYKTLLQQQMINKRRNAFLHYKLINFLKKRRMDHALREEEFDSDAQARYDKRLDELCLLREQGHREQAAELADIAYMTELVREQTEQSAKDFRSMQIRERDVGKGLVDTRTGKQITDKQIERLISRQNSRSQDITKIRLSYITKKEQVKSLEQHIRTLETIDGKFHLIEYEQLRMENQNYNDKIEERDEELTKLRHRYYHAVQALAHAREKCCIIDIKIEDLNIDYDDIQSIVTQCRERMNDYKVQRDENRADTLKLKEQSGLLTYTKLLCDMETCMEELEKIREEVAKMKALYFEKNPKLINIRKNIEYYQYKTQSGVEIPEKQLKTQKKRSSKDFQIPKVYKGRPSLLLPRLPSEQIQRRMGKLYNYSFSQPV